MAVVLSISVGGVQSQQGYINMAITIEEVMAGGLTAAANDWMVDRMGLSPAQIIHALYLKSRCLGLGHLSHIEKTDAESLSMIEGLIGDGHRYFDYLNGRVMKVRLPVEGENYINCRMYDRDNGVGAGEAALLQYAMERR